MSAVPGAACNASSYELALVPPPYAVAGALRRRYPRSEEETVGDERSRPRAPAPQKLRGGDAWQPIAPARSPSTG